MSSLHFQERNEFPILTRFVIVDLVIYVGPVYNFEMGFIKVLHGNCSCISKEEHKRGS